MSSAITTGSRIRLHGLPLLAMTCLLAGCISVFPEADPAQLYRFGDTIPQARATAPGSPGFNVFLGRTDFNRAAAGDRILTISGAQAAYIQGARWVSSSEDLFNAALQQAFGAGRGPARLVTSGDIAAADYMLQLQVHRFEVRYRAEGAVPEIAVEVRATLTDTKSRTVVAEQGFGSTVTAGENRVGAIVAAFDEAAGLVLRDLVAWVDARGQDSGESIAAK